jgi:Ran GTPase-activating protein (RanGAP) involved in mRNA processing and transport
VRDFRTGFLFSRRWEIDMIGFQFNQRYCKESGMSRIDDLIKENLSEDGTVLSLREKYIGLRGTMELFTKGDILQKVKVLTYSGNQIGDEGAESIAECPYLKNLENLVLNLNEIGDEGAILLANSPNLPKVTQMSLFGNVIGDEGARAFADSPQSKKLIKLDLYKNQFSPTGIKALTESKNLKNCEELEIYRE